MSTTEETKEKCAGFTKTTKLAKASLKRKHPQPLLAPDSALTEDTEHLADLRMSRTSCKPLTYDSVNLPDHLKLSKHSLQEATSAKPSRQGSALTDNSNKVLHEEIKRL